MATAEKLTEHYLTCVICSEFFTDPVTLQCNHTFCRQCLLRFTKTQPEAIRAKSLPCPSCRQLTRVTSPDTPVDDWVNQVKPTHIILGLMDDFGPGAQKSDDTALCDVCKQEGETTPATLWCTECEESFCEACHKFHRRLSVSRDHQVILLSGNIKPKKKSRFLCKEHKTEQIKLFCQDCNKVVCHICSSVDHRQCNKIITIESMLSKVTSVLDTKKTVIKKKIKQRNKQVLQQREQIKGILQHTSRIEEDIKRTSQTVVDQIREKEKKLLDHVTHLRDQQTEEIQAELRLDEITIQTYQQQLQFLEQTLESQSQKDLFALYESSGDCTDDQDVETRPAVGRIRWTQDEDRLRRDVDQLQLGEVGVVKGVNDRTSTAVLHRTIDCMIDGKKYSPWMRDVIVLRVLNGKIIVANDFYNDSVEVFYHMKSNEYHKRLKLSCSPRTMTHVKDMTIAVSCKSKKIVIINLENDPTITSTINTEHEYYGIACCTPTEMFVGGETVDRINLSGSVLKSLAISSHKKPDYIHVTRQKNLIVSEGRVKSIVSVTSEGRKVFNYSPSKYRALRSPQGITTTSSGDVLFVDRDLNKVIQLTETGEFVRDVLTEKDGLDCPRGLCLDDEGLLYVTLEKYVKVYKFCDCSYQNHHDFSFLLRNIPRILENFVFF